MTDLYKNYQNACNAYLQAFCLKHDFNFEDAKNSWVLDQAGTIVMVGDFFVSMETIITDIETDAPEEKFIQWYDYSLTDVACLNYKTWLKLDDPKEHVQFMIKIDDCLKSLKEAEESLLRELKKNNFCYI